MIIDTITPGGFSKNFVNTPLTTKDKIREYGSVEKWAVSMVRGIDGISLQYANNITNASKNNEIENLKLIEHGIFDEKSFVKTTELVTESPVLPNNNALRHPTSLQHYPIINTKIEVLKGEEIARPLNFVVINKSSRSSNSVQELKNKMVLDVLTAELISKATGERIEQMKESYDFSKDNKGNSLDSLDKINQYFEYNYSDNLEETMCDLLKYYIDEQSMKFKFNENFIKYLCTGSEVYHVDIIKGKPNLRIVNPIYFNSDTNTKTSFIEGSSWIREYEFITLAEALERYSEEMTTEEIQITVVNHQYGIMSTSMYNYELYNTANNSMNNYISVTHFEWNSLKKIGYLTISNIETGEIISQDIVDENYKFIYNKEDGIKETIKWTWVNERWGAVRIGQRVLIRVGPIKNPYDSPGNKATSLSRYVGTRAVFSLVDKLKSFQFYYNLTFYKLKRALIASKGKGFIYDIAQLPNRENFGHKEFISVLDQTGIAFIDSAGSPDSERRPNHQGFQVVDRSDTENINSMMQVLDFISREMSLVCGITPQREGQVHQNETYGGIERSVTQSNSITEYLFYIHNECKKKVLEKFLEVSKIAFKNVDKIEYILGDVGKKLLQLNQDDLKNADLGVVISNSGEDVKMLDTLKEMGSFSLKNGSISLSDYINVVSSKSIAFIRKSLERAEEMNQQKQQSMEQMKSQQVAQQQESALNFEARKMQIETESKKEIEAMKGEIAIKVAEIAAEARVASYRIDIDADANNNGLLDVIERDKLQLQREIEHEKLNIDKDKNAIEREKIKQKDRESKSKVEEKKLEISKGEQDIKKMYHQDKISDNDLKRDKQQLEIDKKRASLRNNPKKKVIRKS